MGGTNQLQVTEGERSRSLEVHHHEPQDGQQHEQPATLGDKKKLCGGVNSVLVSPDGNEKIQRNQGNLPEHEKQEKIEGDEHAGESRENEQQIEMEKADGVFDGVP